MDNSQDLKRMIEINENSQRLLDDIKNMNAVLFNADSVLRDKIRSKYAELENLNKEYMSIIDTYTQIIQKK